MRTFLANTILAIVVGSAGMAQTTSNLTITPSSPIFDCKNISGVPLDSAPGFAFGSFASTGGPATLCAGGGGPTFKTDMKFTPASLFGSGPITVGDIASISYWTKKSSTHGADPADWYLVIYTKPYAGQLGGGWYGVRINTEPYFAINLNDPANTWNQWSTSGPDNQLRFFESTYGYFGSSIDPDFSTFLSGSSLAGSRGPGVPYAMQPILYFSVQTGSGTSAGFTGKVDGLRIQLVNGSTATVNFEPFLVATDKDSCKAGGWVNLYRADGTKFKNQSDCIQYVNTGK